MSEQGLRVLIVAALMAGVSGCADAEKGRVQASVQPSYDKATGRLTELAYDSNTDGQVDTWTEMDGTRPLRSRIDTNGDGRINRWEDYDEHGGLARVGFSRRDSGTADAWVYPGAGGALHRIELSSTADEARIDRWEYYEALQAGPDGRGALVRAEEDTTGDGRVDRWETYEGGALRTVAFDESGDGRPDRRVTYLLNGGVVIESHPNAAGQFARRVEAK
jgi:hypothetical protein